VRDRTGGEGGPAIAGFRLLWHRVELDTTRAEPDVADALRYLVTGAEHHFDPVSTMHYAVRADTDGTHRIYEEGDLLDSAPTAEAVLDVVYRRVHQRAFELASLRGWVRLHGAVADCAGGRVLMVAPSGTGKTTLSCRLLFDGVAVAADESVMIRDGASLPVARRFHLKPHIEDVIPDLRPYAGDLPALNDGSVRAFDPTEAGFAWPLEEIPVSHVVLLERGTGTSTMAPVSAVAVMPEIVAESFPHQEPVGTLLAQIAALLAQARCWRLRMDSLVEAAELVASLPSGEYFNAPTEKGVNDS
jgi:hypothetical protein